MVSAPLIRRTADPTSGDMRLVTTALVALSLALAPIGPVGAAEIHYAPTENLERVDVALIGSAEETLDVAAYVLSDWPVADALVEAASRGVVVRLVLDRSQLPHAALDRLAPLGGSVRVSTGGAIMHLKSYAVDGRRLRTGSANFSASGLKRQANDLIVLDEPEAVAAFGRAFEREWGRATELRR